MCFCAVLYLLLLILVSTLMSGSLYRAGFMFVQCKSFSCISQHFLVLIVWLSFLLNFALVLFTNNLFLQHASILNNIKKALICFVEKYKLKLSVCGFFPDFLCLLTYWRHCYSLFYVIILILPKCFIFSHLNMFSGMRPFPCPHCEKVFRTSGHRKTHIASHFKSSQLKKNKFPRKTHKTKASKSVLPVPDIPLQEPILITDYGMSAGKMISMKVLVFMDVWFVFVSEIMNMYNKVD